MVIVVTVVTENSVALNGIHAVGVASFLGKVWNHPPGLSSPQFDFMFSFQRGRTVNIGLMTFSLQ